MRWWAMAAARTWWRVRTWARPRLLVVAGWLDEDLSPGTAVDASPRASADSSAARDLRACCPIAADRLYWLDLALAMAEPAIRLAYATGSMVPLEVAVHMAAGVGVEIEFTDPRERTLPGFLAELDQGNAAAMAAVLAGCPCTRVRLLDAARPAPAAP